MNENRATLEVIAPTIEEAIEKGLRDLGLPQDEVDVEILDEGSKGLFGLGSRHARIRLVIKSAQSTEQPQPAKSSPPRVAEAPRMAAKPKEPPSPLPVEVEQEEEEAYEDEGEKDLALQVTHDTLQELLEKMRITASISTRFAEPEDNRSRLTVQADISGKDLSVLIGRQAETLNALQYIASLIVSKELGRSITLSVDVQGYRQRREQQIRQLARRMAEQAIKTGRRQVLEPMPANERRLVHLELRENPSVKTESIGEDPRRKVTIVPR
jgi:spoIIIJ-associated protein